ncbi:MAG: hypothetical protein ACYDCQ_15115 [Dehalococcoidia bacterium]
MLSPAAVPATATAGRTVARLPELLELPELPGHQPRPGQAHAADLVAPALIEALGTPLRCRLGFHSWVPVGMSLPYARISLSTGFCRCCPALRRS